jgi:hypothetical protein
MNLCSVTVNLWLQVDQKMYYWYTLYHNTAAIIIDLGHRRLVAVAVVVGI